MCSKKSVWKIQRSTSTCAPPGAIKESGSESIPPEAVHPDILPNISKALLSPPCIRFFVILREFPAVVVVVAAPAVAEPVVVVPPEPEEPEAANGFQQTSAYTQSLRAAYINSTNSVPPDYQTYTVSYRANLVGPLLALLCPFL